MTSTERHDARYKRRKAKRNKKNLERSKLYANLDRAFTFSKVMYYADKCCNGVGYKKSTQNFQLHEFSIIACTCYNIKNNKYKVGNTYNFIINERGKVRNINAPHIKDRLVHKVLSNEIINPLYSPHLIYDNGASMIDKGFKFCIDRVKLKLQRWVRKYGLNGYVITIDFSKFFENVSHDIIKDIHKKYIFDEYTRKVIEDYLFVGKGLALGVEIAQREACMYPNELDHYLVTNKCAIERYMDDTFLIVKTLNEAEEILNKYYKIANNLKIVINKNKTKIIPLNKYFNYCKWHFYIDSNGKVIVIPDKSTIYRQRRKLRRMIKNNISYKEIETTIASFIAYLKIGNSNKYINYLYNCNSTCI